MIRTTSGTNVVIIAGDIERRVCLVDILGQPGLNAVSFAYLDARDEEIEKAIREANAKLPMPRGVTITDNRLELDRDVKGPLNVTQAGRIARLEFGPAYFAEMGKKGSRHECNIVHCQGIGGKQLIAFGRTWEKAISMARARMKERGVA